MSQIFAHIFVMSSREHGIIHVQLALFSVLSSIRNGYRSLHVGRAELHMLVYTVRQQSRGSVNDGVNFTSLHCASAVGRLRDSCITLFEKSQQSSEMGQRRATCPQTILKGS